MSQVLFDGAGAGTVDAVPRELVRPVLAPRRHPRLGAAAAGALLLFLLAGWVIASRSDARSDPSRIRVEYQQPADVDGAYRVATGAQPEPKTGTSGCAHGVPDERSWSRPGAPEEVVGRFWCGVADGRAEMWWTEGDTLAHAIAPDADLGALYSWWLKQ